MKVSNRQGIGAAIIPIAPGQERDLWGSARHIKSEHAGPVSRAGLILALQMISDAVENISDVEGALDFIEPVFSYQVVAARPEQILRTVMTALTEGNIEPAIDWFDEHFAFQRLWQPPKED